MAVPIPSNWAPVITQVNTSIRQAWSSVPVEYPLWVTTVPMPDKEVFEDAWIGRMPKFRLWSGPRLYQTPNPQTYRVTPEPFELSYTIDQFKWMDDGFGVFAPMISDLSLQGSHLPEYQARDFIEASGAWSSTASQAGLDGLSFFSTAHQTNLFSLTSGTLNAGTAYCNDFTGGGITINGVIVGGALSTAAILTIAEYMPTIRAEDGERLRVTMTHLMHPSTLRAEVEYNLKNMLAAGSAGYTTYGAAQTQVGATDNVTRRFGIEPYENKNLASFTKWYGMDLSKSVKPVRLIDRMKPTFVPLVEPTQEIVVNRHQLAWVGTARLAMAWSPSWLMARSGP
jgi:phage major head subunit gpT-like protein